VKARTGEWIDIEIPWNHFVINIGDLMAYWTNDRWISNLHRVVSSESGNSEDRFSLAFFHNPNSEALVECIPTCHSSSNPIKYKKVYSGDFLWHSFIILTLRL